MSREGRAIQGEPSRLAVLKRMSTQTAANTRSLGRELADDTGREVATGARRLLRASAGVSLTTEHAREAL
jgi:phage-related tail protein